MPRDIWAAQIRLDGFNGEKEKTWREVAREVEAIRRVQGRV